MGPTTVNTDRTTFPHNETNAREDIIDLDSSGAASVDLRDPLRLPVRTLQSASVHIIHGTHTPPTSVTSTATPLSQVPDMSANTHTSSAGITPTPSTRTDDVIVVDSEDETVNNIAVACIFSTLCIGRTMMLS